MLCCSAVVKRKPGGLYLRGLHLQSAEPTQHRLHHHSFRLRRNRMILLAHSQRCNVRTCDKLSALAMRIAESLFCRCTRLEDRSAKAAALPNTEIQVRVCTEDGATDATGAAERPANRAANTDWKQNLTSGPHTGTSSAHQSDWADMNATRGVAQDPNRFLDHLEQDWQRG